MAGFINYAWLLCCVLIVSSTLLRVPMHAQFYCYNMREIVVLVYLNEILEATVCIVATHAHST